MIYLSVDNIIAAMSEAQRRSGLGPQELLEQMGLTYSGNIAQAWLATSKPRKYEKFFGLFAAAFGGDFYFTLEKISPERSSITNAPAELRRQLQAWITPPGLKLVAFAKQRAFTLVIGLSTEMLRSGSWPHGLPLLATGLSWHSLNQETRSSSAKISQHCSRRWMEHRRRFPARQ